ncbi:MAG: ferredoxin [Castellaniella sp.]|uniref:ferredoxin n=1 Tax=Castellaniella sp. TaxID=1955812 RepID=UPI003C76E938
MYVIVTSKPGLFTSTLDVADAIVESYQYLFYGRCKAVFQLARLDAEAKVCIVEDEPPHTRNIVSTKFLDHFDTLDQARAELNHLVRFGSLDAVLQRCQTSDVAVG